MPGVKVISRLKISVNRLVDCIIYNAYNKLRVSSNDELLMTCMIGVNVISAFKNKCISDQLPLGIIDEKISH